MSRRHQRLLTAVMFTAALLFAGVGGWKAASPHPVTFNDRVSAVDATLRCPTCQGLSAADSPSPVAAGIRREVAQQLAAGASETQVRAYFVTRYGTWILLDPPRRGLGWLLWVAPPLLLLIGVWLLRRVLRGHPTGPPPTAADRAAAAQFAHDTPADRQLPEPVAAGLTDLAAARRDAALDPAAADDVDAALDRLARALTAHPWQQPARTSGTVPAGASVTASVTALTAPAPRRRAAGFALPVVAVAFAVVLGVSLARGVGARAAGGLPTGSNPAAASAGSPSAADLTALHTTADAHPSDAAAWLAYAVALDRAGRLADAEPAYRRTLAVDPADITAQEDLGYLLIRGGSPTEAVTLLAPLSRRRTDDPQVVLLLGLAQSGAHQQQATATLRHYLQLAPHSAQAPYIRAILAQHQ